MKKAVIISALSVITTMTVETPVGISGNGIDFSLSRRDPMTLSLPQPRDTGPVSLETALLKRRSVRSFDKTRLRLDEIGQLLWAAQGITRGSFYRTVPSAGALYPLEILVAAGDAEGLPAGIYLYIPKSHSLIRRAEGDIRARLAGAALGQGCVADAAVVFIIAGIYERTTSKYGQRGVRYVHLEAGHAAQNLCLQAVVLGLGTVVIGAFDDAGVATVASLRRNEEPLYLIPAGRPAP